MLSFLRNNSVKIVYGIVISFVVTTFMGVVFFNESFQSSKDTTQIQNDRESAVAIIGDTPVSNQMFQLEYRRLQSQIPKGTQINNTILEQLQINAIGLAVENTLLLEAGKKQGVKATRSEVNTALFSVMDQFGVDSKKALKGAIESSGGSYASMLNQLKNDIIASKTKRAILSSVSINDLDIEKNKFKYQIRELFISKRTTNNIVINDQELYDNAMAIRSRITDSETFIKEKYLIDLKINPKEKTFPPRWVTINQIQPEIARAIYSMNIKEISQPIRTINGYFILELSDKSELSVTQQITEENLLKGWENNTFYSFLYDTQNGRDIRILDPNLKALKFKSEGRFDEAIEAYQAVMSQDPSNPYPNLLIAQLHLIKGDVANAKQWLLKGVIKESLISDTIVLPEIHVLLAEIYNQEGLIGKRDNKYDDLIKDSNKNMALLNYLKGMFEKSKDTQRLKKVKNLIAQASVTTNIIEDASALTKEKNSDFLNEIESSETVAK